MYYDFDQIINRTAAASVKWQRYGEGVLPLWVADMDFVCPEPVIEAIHRRAEHRLLGYSSAPPDLRGVIRERLKRLYHWIVEEEEIIFMPGVVTGLNLAFLICAEAGEGVIAQPPVYFHLLDDPVRRGRLLADPPLVQKDKTYEIDFDAFEAAITPETRIFLLCNPHNPVGRVFRRDELERLAGICLRHNLIICSDEIHCDLIYPGLHHIPIASIAPEIAVRSITLMSPSKTFNVAGLGFAFAVIKDRVLRKKWEEAARGIVPWVNIMGYEAALAAFRDGQKWLDQALRYLRGNRDFLNSFVRERLPGLSMSTVEATYLAWLDCRKAGVSRNPFHFFLEEARVALNDGAEFGKGGEGFVRLNFACPRSRLKEALERMELVLQSFCHGPEVLDEV